MILKWDNTSCQCVLAQSKHWLWQSGDDISTIYLQWQCFLELKTQTLQDPVIWRAEKLCWSLMDTVLTAHPKISRSQSWLATRSHSFPYNWFHWTERDVGSRQAIWRCGIPLTGYIWVFQLNCEEILKGLWWQTWTYTL